MCKVIFSIWIIAFATLPFYAKELLIRRTCYIGGSNLKLLIVIHVVVIKWVAQLTSSCSVLSALWWIGLTFKAGMHDLDSVSKWFYATDVPFTDTYLNYPALWYYDFNFQCNTINSDIQYPQAFWIDHWRGPSGVLEPLLLTWFNFNSSMDK